MPRELRGVSRMPDPELTARLDLLKRWSRLLDNAFVIPGTSIRFGLDPILGLFPGIGDLVTPAFSVLLLVHGNRVGLPKVLQARMIANVVIDTVIGVVPLLGDLFDLGWKANIRNMALLEQHHAAPAQASRGDWLFVAGLIVLLIACAAVPLVLAAWLFSRLF